MAQRRCGTGSISGAAGDRSAPGGTAGTGGNASGNSADESTSECSAVKRQPDNTRIQRAMSADMLWGGIDGLVPSRIPIWLELVDDVSAANYSTWL